MTKKLYSLAEFSLLPLALQLDILQRDGAYVGKLTSAEEDRILYQLGAFYVELRYTEYRKTISSVEVTSDLAILQPYLDQIQFGGQ